jgi:2-polyprenyl-6-methoxyphenol hydroxylase-like FAD-dependent oxidoreductase
VDQCMRVAVIGAGIAGATTALALAAVGAQVEVFEEACQSAAQHRGWVTLGPAAMTSLDQIGVGSLVRDRGFPVTKIVATDTRDGTRSSLSRYEPTHRWPSTHIWRRDLLTILRLELKNADIPCHYGAPVAARELTADLTVGADGARSQTRQAVGNPHRPTYTGQSIIYGHHPEPVRELAANTLHFWQCAYGTAGYVGDARDGAFWFSLYNTGLPTDRIALDARFAPLAATPVAGILEASHASESIALYELSPEGIWHNSDTVIIGDAAHAVSPSAGRGATSAIEDAIILARHIYRSRTIASALASYEADRRPPARQTYRPTPGQAPIRITADNLKLI